MTILCSFHFILIAKADFKDFKTRVHQNIETKKIGYDISEIIWNNESADFLYYNCNAKLEFGSSSRKVEIKSTDESSKTFCQNQFVKYVLPDIVSPEIASKVLNYKNGNHEFKFNDSYININSNNNDFFFMLFECSDDLGNCPNELIRNKKQIENGEVYNPKDNFIPVYEKN